MTDQELQTGMIHKVLTDPEGRRRPYVFITPDGAHRGRNKGQDVFAHASAFDPDVFNQLIGGERVSYRLSFDERHQKMQAAEVEVL
jgi:cold shock CspA family protein